MYLLCCIAIDTAFRTRVEEDDEAELAALQASMTM